MPPDRLPGGRVQHNSMALLRRRLWLVAADASHLSASIDCQSIIYWPGMYLGTPVKNGITIGGSATCSITQLSAHIRASRRSGEGSPESGSQSNSGNDTSNAR
jgi:hypothetical protein